MHKENVPTASDDNFVAALLNTTVTIAKNTVTDGGSYETVTAKMHLPSTTEVGLANENNIAEGVKLALFSDNTSRLAYPTAECVSNSDYTNSGFKTSAAWYYWLRTPNSGLSYDARNVGSSGTLSHLHAYHGMVIVCAALERAVNAFPVTLNVFWFPSVGL